MFARQAEARMIRSVCNVHKHMCWHTVFMKVQEENALIIYC